MAGPDRVELRVHGVSGTPPESMLDHPWAVQVAGDDLGRVFRRADDTGAEEPPRDGHVVEAYNWSALTSGSAVQALWLLLAPFGLVNAAQFTLLRPSTPLARAAHGVAGAMLRLVGLALTALFVLAAAVITADLWAWQRAGATSGLTYVLALLAPVALLVLYALLARPKPDPDVRPHPVGEIDGAPSELVRPTFFEGDTDAPALRLLHVAAGLSMVAMLAVCPAALLGGAVGPVVFWVAFGLLALVTIAVLVLGDPSAQPGWGRAPRKRPMAHAVARILLWAGIVVLLVGLAILGAVPPDITARTFPSTGALMHYPGIDWTAFLVLGFAVGGLVVLSVACGVLAFCERAADVHDNPSFAPYLRGTAAGALGAVGLFLGVGYAGAFTTAAAAALQSVGPEGSRGDGVAVMVPELFSRAVYAWGLSAALFAVLGAVAGWRWWMGCRRFRTGVEDDFRVNGRVVLPRRWVDRTAQARCTARLKNLLPSLTGFCAALGTVLTAFTVVEVFPIGVVDPRAWPRLGAFPLDLPGVFGLFSQSAQWPSASSDGAGRTVVLALGTLALSSFAAALLTLGRSALVGESDRRALNVVWDVIAFWPRATHPFVPATYAQRAVVDIENRIRWHVGQGRSVVVGAHSQGSLLGFAALTRIAAQPDAAQVLPHVGLLTFGSQLQVMFSRAFPAYVNLAAITKLHGTLHGAWVNLYRDTDPLAGPVLSWNHRPDRGRGPAPGWVGSAPRTSEPAGEPAPPRQEFGPDWRLFDPPVLVRPPADGGFQDRSLLPLRGHGAYWLDVAWDDAVAAVRERMGRGDPPELLPPVPSPPEPARP